MIPPSFERYALLGFADIAMQNPDAEVPLWASLDIDSNERPGTAPDGAVGIYLDVAPEGIDSVTLTDYTVSDDPSLSDTVLGIQVRISCEDGDVRSAIQSDLFALFHGRWGGMLGRVKLVMASRESGTNVGQDSSERRGRIENYYATVHRPSPHRQ